MIAAEAVEHQIVAKLLTGEQLNGASLAAIQREAELFGLPLIELL